MYTKKAEKGAPFLARGTKPFDHVFGNTRLCDLKSELEQFPVNTRPAPERVLHARSPDQSAQLSADLRPPSPQTRFSASVAAETGAMPPNDRLQLNDGEDPQNRGASAVKLDQEQSIEAGLMHSAADRADTHVKLCRRNSSKTRIAFESMKSNVIQFTYHRQKFLARL
jgi:hypothetical protein